MASSSVSTAVRGNLYKKFSFERASFENAVEIPLIMAVVGPPMLWLLIASFDHGVGPEAGRWVTSLFWILLIVGAPSFLLAFGLPVWLKRPLSIEIYDNGIACHNKFFQWDDLDAINTTQAGAETNCQLYANDEVVFSITETGPTIGALVRYIQDKTEHIFFNQILEKFMVDGVANFGNTRLTRIAIEQNNYQIAFHDIADLTYDNNRNCLLVRHKNGFNLMIVILEDLSNGHILLSFLRYLMSRL